MQEACADKPIEVIVPAEEEVKVKPTVFSQRSREDYYGSLSYPCRDSYNSDAHMDSLKVNTELFSPCFTLFMHSCCNPKQPDHVFFFSVSFFFSNLRVRSPLRRDTLSPPPHLLYLLLHPHPPSQRNHLSAE